MNLSNTQKHVYEKYLNGENVFMTGPGGSGKSALIKLIYEDATKKHKNIQVCALTGCAASLLDCGARTIHSWSGVGLGNKEYTSIIRDICRKKCRKNWINVDILVIDEISMLSIELLELLNHVAQHFKKNNKPFGGIQLIASGDFYQLPPVNSDNFCFESDLWNVLFKNQIELKTIFRQSDPILKKILNQIRKGKISKTSYEILLSRTDVSHEDLEIQPIILHSNKYKVESLNSSALKKIKEDSHTFSATTNMSDGVKISDKELQYELNNMLKNSGFYEKLELKKGAKVLSTVNYADTFETTKPIYNGCEGIVTDFNEEGFPIVKFINGAVKIIKNHTWTSDNITELSVNQIPLILAWAITIHKSQGLSLDNALIYVGDDVFEAGQMYVAISRVRSINGLYLKEFNHKKIKANEKVGKYYESLHQINMDNMIESVDVNESSEEKKVMRPSDKITDFFK